MLELNKESSDLLINSINNHRAVLMLGSGASLDSINSIGSKVPSTDQLCELLKQQLKMSSDEPNNLKDLFTAFSLATELSPSMKKTFMSQHFEVTQVPLYVNNVAAVCWYKIYTTNIDSTMEIALKRTNRDPKVLRYPFHEFSDVDQSLQTSLLVHLHGKVPCDLGDLIFGRDQYATASIGDLPLYNALIREYSTMCTIFVGTSLDEPIFDILIAQRMAKRDNEKEKRKRSFLIAPNLSDAKQRNYRLQYNIEFVQGTFLDFAEWIERNVGLLATAEDIVHRVYPNVASFPNVRTSKGLGGAAVLSAFTYVGSLKRKTSPNRSYYIGRSPTWDDIYNELDATRDVTAELTTVVEGILSAMSQSSKCSIIFVHGASGSGKSTISKRIAVDLTASGYTVLHTHSDVLPHENEMHDFILSHSKPLIIQFDNAELNFAQIARLVDKCCEMSNALFVVYCRTTFIDRLRTRLSESCPKPLLIEVGALKYSEAEALVEKLDTHGRLGKLKALPARERVKAFLHDTSKQLLVAMRQATEGRRFDDIIRDEFSSIKDDLARRILVTLSLSTEHGAALKVSDLIAALGSSPNSVLNAIDNHLKSMVVYVGSGNDKVMVRHRMIAEVYLDQCVNGQDLLQANVDLLKSLALHVQAKSLSDGLGVLYRALINHGRHVRRFGNNPDLGRSLYEMIHQDYSENFHYWLQRGAFETELFDADLDSAVIYLETAQGLATKSRYAANELAYCRYKRAFSAHTYAQAIQELEMADELTNDSIKADSSDPYAWTIQLEGQLAFVLRWESDDLYSVKPKLEEIHSIAKGLLSKFSGNEPVKEVSRAAEHWYLLTATNEFSGAVHGIRWRQVKAWELV